MKKLIVLFLLIPIVSFSQSGDWHPFPEGQTSYFADIPKDSTSEFKYKYINALRIDSIVLLANKYYYFNMRSPVKIGEEEEFNYYDPYSSWIGKFMNFSFDRVYFSDISGKNYSVNLSKTDDYPHYSASISDTSILLVTLDSISYGSIFDGLMDSLKYFSFHYHRNWDTPLEHKINGMQMVFSKNYGLVKTFAFGSMHSIDEIREKSIIGLVKNDEAYGFQWDIDSITTSYQIGDEYQIFQDADSWRYYQYYLIDKQYEENTINYVYQRCIDKNNPSFDTVHQNIQINLMPGQSIFRENIGFFQAHMYKDEIFGRRTYMLRYYDDVAETYFLNQFVWRWEWPVSNSMIYPPYYHINSTGKYLYWTNYEEDYHELIYYSNAFETWGEPHMFSCNVGIEELQNQNLLISPNPSNGFFNITSSEQIEEVKVFNLNGQIVWQANELDEESIDLSALENGIYLFHLKTKSQEILYQKVVIGR